MALTKCTVPTDVIGTLGTTVEERGISTQQFKDKFDEMPEGIKTYLNDTLTVEVDAALAAKETPAGAQAKADTVQANLTSHSGTQATDSILGHVKADNITIKASSGIISAEGLFKSGTLTRDTSLASGTQAITGLGFKPKAVIFFSTIGGLPGSASWGVDASQPFCMLDNYTAGANSYATTAKSVFSRQSGGDYSGNIQSMDTDGFTINWTKSGTTTGTLTVIYLAFR